MMSVTKAALIASAMLCPSCLPSGQEAPMRCEQFGRDISRPTKIVSNGECFVQCPEPVGWIAMWMWADNHGCAPRSGSTP